MDYIQNLLLQTGWSCEDLISKLTEFKEKTELRASDNSVCNDGKEVVRLKCDEKPPLKCNDTEEAIRLKCDGNNSNDIIPIKLNCDIRNVMNCNGKEKLKVTSNKVTEEEDLSVNTMQTRRELSDHTYTLKVQCKKRIVNKRFNRVKAEHFRLISICRRSNFLFKARHSLWRHLRRKKVDRKALIAQYKSPEVVRSQIVKQLLLLRSKKSTAWPNHSGVIRKEPSEDRIVNKKRYNGERCSDILNELMEMTEDQNVEIESTDILQSNGEIIIEDNFEVYQSSVGFQCYASTSKVTESIAETIKNRIGVQVQEQHDKSVLEFQSNRFLMESSRSISTEGSDALTEIIEGETVVDGIKNIMIVDVRGGCDIIPDDKHTIKPTKTKDVTKIKGWKNKKFDIGEKQSNAAFSSSNLDGFLEAADLHISFKIPTLDSGSDTTRNPTPKVSPKDNPQNLNLYHPRTWGQKKRIMKLKYELKSKRNLSRKPRTLAEKRRLLGNSVVKKIREKPNSKYSYIMYRGRRLRVVTKSQKNEVIAYIKPTIVKPSYILIPKTPRETNKPSIFKTSYSPTGQILHYRPGPLCHKANLQYDNQNWKTILKRLPKARLTIAPEYKKPIHPRIRRLLPEYGFDITPDRLEFALTALAPQKKEVTCFEFNVPYQNNQQEILLRKQIKNSIEATKHNDTSVEETCRDIMDKILNYLEIKEISDDIIKNDVNTLLFTEDKTTEQTNDKSSEISKKRPRPSNKTNYELKRLNVKVIEVDLEEKEEIENCNRDFCRLGCVCRSLTTTSSLLSNHCGRPDCMFECSCNYERKSKGNVRVTFPIGTDLLSEGAVNRLEGEAKKNLAKVEKEFTQTVIQANNQTIVVGGCTNRQRRVTKVPKKYTDYVENLEYIPANLLRQNEMITETCKVVDGKLLDCQINLTKLALDDIIPYCLVHNIRDCFCKYQAPYIDFNMRKVEKHESELERNASDSNKTSESNKSDPYSDDNETTDVTDMLEMLEEEFLPSDIKKYRRRSKPSEDTDCARTKGIPTNYYIVRNRTNKFIMMRNKKFARNMIRERLSHDMQVDIDLKPTENPSNTERTNDYVKVINEKSRRKQELVARIDRDMCIVDPPEKALKKSRKPLKKQFVKKIPEETNSPPETKLLDKDNNSSIQKFKTIFPLAQENVHYFQPSPDIAGQFVNMLGKKATTTFCLLQWQTLATNYRLGKINVWFSSYFRNFPTIVISDLNIVPKYFTNIKNFESDANRALQKNEIVKALITDNIPSSNPKDEVQVILELTDILCHVHGIIKKNRDKQENLLVPEVKAKVIQTQSLFEKNDTPEKKTTLPYPTVRKIMFSKICCLEYNYLTVDKDNENILPCSIMAHLPTTKSNMLWRMIKLNSDFSVLSLDKKEYRIKYSDLQKVLKMADDKNMTIAIRTEQETTSQSHKDFGIYASPKCQNAIFVGPYYKTENHDITLMRYLNRELVPTKLFNKMKGLSQANIGVWIEQTKDAHTAEKSLHTIDLTESDQEEDTNAKDEDTGLLLTQVDLEKYENECENYIATQNNYVEADHSKKLPVLQGNVYFSTNIASVGYILGHQLTGDAVVLRYPTYNSVLRFKNHAHAVLFLEKEFTSLFISAPEFTIKIIISSREDSTGIVFNPEFLRGYYIMSNTGLTNILDLTSSKLKEFKMTELDLDKSLKSRASRTVYDLCLEAAKTSLSGLTFKQKSSTKSLTIAMKMQIESLMADQERLKMKRLAILQQKPVLLEHFKKIFLKLAPHTHPRLKAKMKEMLRRHGKLVDTVAVPTLSPEVIYVDSELKEDEKEKKSTSPCAQDASLPIYTKNPDMIITATISKENSSGNTSRIIENKLENTNSETSDKISERNTKMSDKKGVFKYVWKTASGKIIEIGPKQYEMFRAQHKLKTPLKTFQIGAMTITPKLSKIELEPILGKLPTAECKRITVPDNLPPGFVKLTLKNISQNATIESNTANVQR